MRTFLVMLMLAAAARGAAQTTRDPAAVAAGEARSVSVYRVNLYTLLPSARLDSLRDEIARAGERLDYVWVAGSASPEGPVRWNRTLGERRARALRDYLLRNTSLSPAQIQLHNLGEDWEGTCRAIGGTDFPHAGRILHIVDSVDDWARRKRLIQDIDGGRTWRRLLREVFPALRNSRIWTRTKESPRGLAWRGDTLSVSAPGARPALVPLPLADAPPLALPQPAASSPRMIALKTNLLLAAATVANLGVEVQTGRRWSVDVPVYYSPYDITPRRKLRLLATQPAVRWWPRGAMRRGFFWEAHGTVAGFNIAVSDRARYQDPEHAAWGAGLGAGWCAPLGKRERWALQCNLGAGFVRYRYNEFENVSQGALRRRGRGTWWGPTKAAVTIGYQWPMAAGKRRAGR